MVPHTAPVLPDLAAPMVAWALYYAELGMPVFPCRGKAPLISKALGGHGFYDASTDQAQILSWWQRYPTANIGYRTSATSFVIDVDPQHQGDDTLFALEQAHGVLPDTRRVITGGPSKGTHYHFTSPEPIPNKSFLGVGIDIQAEGSYIIVPPSLHPATGQPYRWDIGPDELAPQALPDWLFQLMRAGDVSQAAASTLLDPTAPIPEGQRTTTLARLAIRLRRVAGLSADELLVTLAKRNERCVPPKPEDFLVSMAHYVYGKYAPDPVMHVGGGPDLGAPGHTNGITAQADQQWGTPLPVAMFADLADMVEKKYPLPRWLIKDLIAEGLTLLAGSPKSSKTYLAHALALSLAMDSAHGGLWLGHYPLEKHGPVVYVSLEDDEADSYWRVRELVPTLTHVERDRLIFCNDFEHIPAFEEGLVPFIEERILKRYAPVLLVLDPLSYLYASAKRSSDQFADVKKWLLPLRYLAKKYETSILGVEHRRKQSKDDIDLIETIHGSQAKMAIADGMLVIVRDQTDVTLHARIRKAREQTISLGFEFAQDGTARWTWKGSTDGLLNTGNYSDLRQRVSDVLSASPIALNAADILFALHMAVTPQSRNMLHQLLRRMEHAQEVLKDGRGNYTWLRKGPP